MLDYLGRYTHRVAISNHRLLSFDGHEVTFRRKDYRQEAACKTMTLTADEFIRRFLHVLPDGFKHIRSYGWLANRAGLRSRQRCPTGLRSRITGPCRAARKLP